MNAVLLDTDVLSFLYKGDSRAEIYRADLLRQKLCLSFQSVAELMLWSLKRNWGVERRQRLDAVLKHYLILPYDAAMSHHWAEITAHRLKLGSPISCGDAWVAAAAIRFGLPLVTHNRKDYSDAPNLKVISHS